MRRPLWPWIPLVLAGALLLPELAEARVGGGHGYSGGGGGGGGGGFGGGGGGGDAGLIRLLIWLCIQYPAIGIPLVIGIAIVVIYNKTTHERRIGGYHSHQAAPMPRPPRAPRPHGIPVLRARDPNFSEPLFVDFVQLVYARGHELRGSGQLQKLRPWFSTGALAKLPGKGPPPDSVEDVVFGASRIEAVELEGTWARIRVRFETNLTEVSGGRRTQLLRDERWTFRRRVDVLSPGPEGMQALSCPACGSTADAKTDGTCPNCGAARTDGQLQWEVQDISVLRSQPLTAPELHLGGGIEPGTNKPTLVDPDLASQRRQLTARNADFDWSAFRDRVVDVFARLQQAWSEQRWELARPYETDPLFQTHRFWMERYARFGLANRLADVEVRKIELAKVGLDAFYESITVRIWASMRDWTERTSGEGAGSIVGGSRTEPRVFTEYWTFLRAIGGQHRPAGAWSADHCPSCGAPLDKVSMAGVCGYCDAKITSGRFDWVLSRIEQDDAYVG